jgi:hypothetical protein
MPGRTFVRTNYCAQSLPRLPALAALTMRAISRCEHSRSDACVSLNECDEFKARGTRYAENVLTSWLVLCSKMVRGCREICLPSSELFEAGKEDRIKKVERRGKRQPRHALVEGRVSAMEGRREPLHSFMEIKDVISDSREYDFHLPPRSLAQASSSRLLSPLFLSLSLSVRCFSHLRAVPSIFRCLCSFTRRRERTHVR